MGLGKFLKKAAGFVGGIVNPIAPALGFAADLIGGRKASKGIEQTNAQQMELAREQMAFQERMSSTAFQRSSADLEKAGLNRILALGSPATSPSGAMATLRNPEGPMGEAISSAPASALQARQASAQMKNLRASTKNIGTQTNLTRATVDTQRALTQEVNQRIRESIQREHQFNANQMIQNLMLDLYKKHPELLYLKESGGAGAAAVGAASRLLPSNLKKLTPWKR